jgi:imidazolonepropionase-like amidohydrolase
MFARTVLPILLLSLCTGCVKSTKTTSLASPAQDNVHVSRISGMLTPTAPVLIFNAVLLTANDQAPKIPNGWLLMENGRIADLGAGSPDESIKKRATVKVDAKGMFVTPGLVDTHSHLGVYATPHVWAHSDGNEMTHPITSGVRAEDAFSTRSGSNEARYRQKQSQNGLWRKPKARLWQIQEAATDEPNGQFISNA